MRLQTQLAKIPDSFLTVVEAPSGFGKTTAIREYFSSVLRDVVCEKWYTCLGESPEKAWMGICAMFSGAEDSIAEDLVELGVPTQESLPDIVTLLHEYQCSEPTYYIIDDYQLFDTTVRSKLLTALSVCRNDSLHIIVVTQPLTDDHGRVYQRSRSHYIGPKDFYFDNACIGKYCRLIGIKISSADVAHIQTVADGWVAAIRLQLQNYKETGLLVETTASNLLVESAVWNRLSEQEKDFLLAVSLLDGFTAQQSTIMGGGVSVPKSIEALLSMDFFIRYVADKKVYSIHSVLRDYLLKHLAMQPHDFIDAAYHKAALACQFVGDYFQAAQFFMKMADYEAILALPFSTQYFYDNKEQGAISFFERVVDQCPLTIMQKYPIALVLIAYIFFRNGSRPYFVKLTKYSASC